jgi:hypothetical protein
MVTSVVAEAGLSGCVRLDVCAPDLGLFVAAWAAAGLLATVWLAVVLYATADVLLAGQGAARTACWLLAVWFLPPVGAAAWFRSRRADGIHARRAETTWAR